jgi:hypothetical protein
VPRLLGHLATIAGFYLVVGVGLVLVVDAGLSPAWYLPVLAG